MTDKENHKNNNERNEDMSKVYHDKKYVSKKTDVYNRKKKDEMIEKIAGKRKGVLKRLSKT